MIYDCFTEKMSQLMKMLNNLIPGWSRENVRETEPSSLVSQIKSEIAQKEKSLKPVLEKDKQKIKAYIDSSLPEKHMEQNYLNSLPNFEIPKMGTKVVKRLNHKHQLYIPRKKHSLKSVRKDLVNVDYVFKSKHAPSEKKDPYLYIVKELFEQNHIHTLQRLFN